MSRPTTWLSSRGGPQLYCVPPLAGARSFAICPNSNTECEYGNCGETGDQHYKCDCIVFEPTQTFCRHHVLSSAGLRQIAGKGGSQSIYLTIYRRQSRDDQQPACKLHL